jgi:hypothetical protein
VADDPHRLWPDHHPTPFSAAEIRAGFVPGRVTRSRVIEGRAAPVVRVRRNLVADADGGVYEFWTETDDGRRIGEPEQARSTWLELQGHASMPIQSTTIEPLVIDVPLGRFDGLLYTRVDGDTVDRFWFAMALPGAPVRMEERVAGELVYSSTAIASVDP